MFCGLQKVFKKYVIRYERSSKFNRENFFLSKAFEDEQRKRRTKRVYIVHCFGSADGSADISLGKDKIEKETRK